MDQGKILLARSKGDYVIRLTGDVRLTLCSTLEGCLQSMFADPAFGSVTIDARDAECLDSTTLGLLAKISFMSQAVTERVPSILTTNPDVTRLLSMMGFEGPIYVFVGEVPDVLSSVDMQSAKELEPCQCDEDEAKSRVLEAHRILMSINESNHQQFRDLVAALEHNESST